VIELPTFEMGLTSGDIFFEFKTSSERPMVLLHSTGDNGDFIKVPTRMEDFLSLVTVLTVQARNVLV
jgi:hypothetical protein